MTKDDTQVLYEYDRCQQEWPGKSAAQAAAASGTRGGINDDAHHHGHLRGRLRKHFPAGFERDARGHVHAYRDG